MTDLKVLIVDDNDLIHFLHKEVLEISDLSQNPIIFFNGKVALDFLKNSRESDGIFLVLLDLDMPIMNGFKFLENISGLSNTDNIHVAVVSSTIDQEAKKKTFEFPNSIDFLEKPLTVTDCEKLKQRLLLNRN